jgi:hypothetical protein
VRIKHDLPLPMIFMGEPLANYVKSLDCRCELVSEGRKLEMNYYPQKIQKFLPKLTKIPFNFALDEFFSFSVYQKTRYLVPGAILAVFNFFLKVAPDTK